MAHAAINPYLTLASSTLIKITNFTEYTDRDIDVRDRTEISYTVAKHDWHECQTRWE